MKKKAEILRWALISGVVFSITVFALSGCLEIEPEPDPGDPIIECGSSELTAEIHNDCGAMDAVGDDACFCMLGFAWNGIECVSLSGCECTGEDCDSLTETLEECEENHSECTDVTPDDCDPWDAEGRGGCFMALGYKWNGTRCEQIGGCECVGEDCDRLTNLEDCEAAHAECVDVVPDECDPWDARGDGKCYMHLGYAWNGSECVALGGCECIGEDCDRVTNLEDCEDQHLTCDSLITYECGDAELFSEDHEGCHPMHARGVGDCHCALGFAFVAGECVSLTGCECVGDDCVALTETLAECEAVHEECIEDYSCGSDDLHAREGEHDNCEAMDAIGDGECYCFLGYVWDGTDCVSIGGCECLGEDCDKLTVDIELCREMHGHCS